MRWEDLYDEICDADDRAEIERLKTRLLADLEAYTPPSPDPEELRRAARVSRSRGRSNH